MRVAMIGAGRLGRLLASRIPTTHEQVIIRRTVPANDSGAIGSDQLSAARGCQVVLLAIPGSAVPAVLRELAAQIDPGTLVANMATDADTAGLWAHAPGLRIVSAKLLGHAVAIFQGAPGMIIVDHASPQELALLAELLGAVGPVSAGKEAMVQEANTAVAEAMVAAEMSLRARLRGLGLDDEMIRCALVTTAPGILRSLADGTAGPFVREVARRVRGE